MDNEYELLLNALAEIRDSFSEEDFIDVVGPLGYGTFKYEDYKNIAVLGGGIGVFPLYELTKNAKKSAKVNTYLGFRDKEAVLLEKEFEEMRELAEQEGRTMSNLIRYLVAKERKEREK